MFLKYCSYTKSDYLHAQIFPATTTTEILTDDVKKFMNERDKLLRKSRKSPHAEFYKAEYKEK